MRGFGAVGAQDESYEIAYLTPGLNVPFWKYLSDGIKQAAAAADATIEVTDYDSRNDAATQLQNAQDAITRGVDAIIISPTDSSTAPAVLELAEESNVPVIIADIGTDSGEYVSFVISSNEQGAYALTDRGTFLAMQDKLPNLVILVGGATIAENAVAGCAPTSCWPCRW